MQKRQIPGKGFALFENDIIRFFIDMLRVFYKSTSYVKARRCAGEGSFEDNDTLRDY